MEDREEVRSIKIYNVFNEILSLIRFIDQTIFIHIDTIFPYPENVINSHFISIKFHVNVIKKHRKHSR